MRVWMAEAICGLFQRLDLPRCAAYGVADAVAWMEAYARRRLKLRGEPVHYPDVWIAALLRGDSVSLPDTVPSLVWLRGWPITLRGIWLVQELYALDTLLEARAIPEKRLAPGTAAGLVPFETLWVPPRRRGGAAPFYLGGCYAGRPGIAISASVVCLQATIGIAGGRWAVLRRLSMTGDGCSIKQYLMPRRGLFGRYRYGQRLSGRLPQCTGSGMRGFLLGSIGALVWACRAGAFSRH